MIISQKMLSTEIRSIINMKSQHFCNISQLVENGKTVQNAKDIVTIFNQYFVNIGSKIDAEIARARKLMDPHFFSFLPTQLKLKSVHPFSIPYNLT